MEKKYVARPYAKAIFEIAITHNRLDEWSKFLQILQDLCAQSAIINIYENPTINNQEVIDVIIKALTGVSDQMQLNFVKVLIDANRLKSLRTIIKVFNTLVSEHLHTKDVEVITYSELSPALTKALLVKLQDKLGISDVKLKCTVEPKILGGIIIKLGDYVIDGSVISKIHNMYNKLLT